MQKLAENLRSLNGGKAFSRIEDAIAARQTAELHLRNTPELFPEWVLQNRRGESRT